ncbi:MAG: fumarylacetoacetate hydrolase family protein [Gammaproteobacteria bacterium]|nr:fumarylacetoacetate hydrolase family protein [Gammaproteobacteria bacterium]
MKLGSLKEGGRDGTLIVVSKDLSKAAVVGEISKTLQHALEHWDLVSPKLESVYQQLNAGQIEDAFELDFTALASPLPRAFEFVDGSAYLPHVERVRKARGAEVPDTFYVDPLMYQGTSAHFLGPRDDIPVVSEDYGIDFEAEIVAITGDIHMAATPQQAGKKILLLGLINDVSLRGLIPGELKKGFGFLQSKPPSAFSPVFVTPDELGDAWEGYEINLPVRSWLNGEWFGEPEAGDNMQFDLSELIAHAAKTRPLMAGTIVGSGTIANDDTGKGASCLAEIRMLEIIANGKPSTSFMKFGDRVKIDMWDKQGNSICGSIEQTVVEYKPVIDV